tara:strand:- start:1853 stop:2086 length:234 start_codon:yes stop_codon:yes gene_type:complete
MTLKEEYRESIYNAINAGGSIGLSLKEIFLEIFDDDKIDVADFNDEKMKIVFNILDDLLEEEVVSFDDEKDLWKCIN